jgi:two-component system sensor kinase FixL
MRKDGSRFLADAVITAIRTPDGTLRAFGEITRDMPGESPPRRGEGQRDQACSLIATVLDTVVDGLITIDRHGIVQSFNSLRQPVRLSRTKSSGRTSAS